MNECEYENCQKLTKTKVARYCSLSCANRVNRKAPRANRRKICLYCHQPFQRKDVDQKFCDRSCSAKYNNGLRTKSTRPCLGCNRDLDWKTSGNYCEKACRQKNEILLWLDGKIDGCGAYRHAAYVQRYLEQRSGLVCEMPGCNESRKRPNGTHILQVDHIDGNWRNNSVENLRIICPSCHALTENWGGYNKGKGRTWKSQYNQYEAK